MSAITQTGPSGSQLARRILALLQPYRGRVAIAAATSLLQGALAAVPALALKQLIEELTEPRPQFASVAGLMLIVVGGVLAGALVGVVGTWLAAMISQGVVSDLRDRLFGHLVGQTIGYHTRARQGDLLSRVLNDVAGIQATVEASVLTVVRNICLLVAVVAVMFVLDWHLALVSLVVLPLVGVPLRLSSRATARARRDVQEQYADMTSYLQETLGLSGLMLVRAFGRQGVERDRFSVINRELGRRQIKAAMTARWFGVAMVVLAACVPAAILLAGGYLVSRGITDFATIAVFATVLCAQFALALQGLATSAVTALGSSPLWQRAFAVLDEEPDVAESPDAVSIESPRGDVAFSAVSFSYPEQPRPAVSDLTFRVAPGQTLAIVGPSGAGKTTLTALAARFADPQGGSISLDGVDLRDLSLESLGRAVGVVFQDPFLFHASLRDNLLFGRPEATQDQLAAVAVEANLTQVIAALPDGWDTLVGERGHRLSGGEKQRVALARALLKDPAVLILDEATAHLDTIAEREVQAALTAATGGRTSLVIAHRLSTVRHADLILVMDAGQVVERGTHDELLAAGGLYSTLHAVLP